MLLKRSKKDIKNVDHMMINHDIATVREFMFCEVSVWKVFFCYWLKKNWQVRALNYHKILNPPFLFSLLKFQKKFPPLTRLVWNLGLPPLQRGERKLCRYFEFEEINLRCYKVELSFIIFRKTLYHNFKTWTFHHKDRCLKCSTKTMIVATNLTNMQGLLNITWTFHHKDRCL